MQGIDGIKEKETKKGGSPGRGREGRKEKRKEYGIIRGGGA